MAHLFESGFFVKQPAWHKLGIVIEDAPSIDEGLRLAGLDWQVEKRPLFAGHFKNEILPDLARHNYFDSHVAIARKTDDKILGVVGSKYTPLQNAEAFNFFEPLVESGLVELDAAGSLRDGRNVWVLAKFKNSAEIIKGDKVDNYLLVSNSHDGTRAVTVMFTSIRVVCWNTLTAAHQNDAGALKIRHCSNVAEGLQAVRTVVDAAEQTFKLDVEKFKALSAKRLPIDGLKNFVCEVIGRDLQTEKEPLALKSIAALYEQGAGVEIPGVKGTYWGAYNAFTEWTDHVRGQSADNRLHNIWFGGVRELKAKALQVALNHCH